MQIQDRDSGQSLQDNGTAFTTTFGGTNNSLNATLGAGTGTTRTWSIPATIATNRNLRVYAQAFTAATGGTADSTKAEKWFESFSTEDQTPTTSITGPSGTQTSTTFTMTGTATDDKGVNSLSYWFRDEQQRYLQNDGTVDDIFNSFRGEPDVIGATNATWSYEVTLPHEGIWRGSATATDTIGQADLRSGVRDWRVDSTVVAPTVAISQPVEMTPPFAAPTVTVEPGSRVTFSGTAEDDQGLKNVEITLRNSSTGEGLANDCSFIAGGNGTCRISPVDIGGSVYNWTYTTPFDLTPGTYSFTVRATDDEDNTTSSNNQGRLTINAPYPGDNPPGTTMAFVAPTDGSLTVNLAGAATDETGVTNVRVSIQDRDTGRYLQANGTMGATLGTREATLGTPNGTTTTWSLPPITLPSGGDWRFSATAYDTRGQFDASPATASYTLYPGDGPPTLSDTLGQPQTGASFDAGKIVVTGRAEDAPDQYAEHRLGPGGRRQRGGPVHELVGHVHQHQPELPHGVPEQPGQRRIELLVHDAGHPGRDLQRPGAAGRRPRPDRCRADLDRHHGDAAVEPAAGARASPTPATRTSAPSTVAARRTRTRARWSTRGTSGRRRAPRSTAAVRCRRGPSPLRARRAHRSR